MADSVLMVRAASAKGLLEALKADRMVDLALQIADDCVRSEVECYAYRTEIDGERFLDTSRAGDDEVAEECLKAVRRALDYIRLRGDAFPWHLKRSLGAPHLVKFVDKEANSGM